MEAASFITQIFSLRVFNMSLNVHRYESKVLIIMLKPSIAFLEADLEIRGKENYTLIIMGVFPFSTS